MIIEDDEEDDVVLGWETPNYHPSGSGHTIVVCVTLLTTRHQTTPDIDAVSEL